MAKLSHKDTPTQISELKAPDYMAYVGTGPGTMAPSGQQVLIYTSGVDSCPAWQTWTESSSSFSSRNLDRICNSFSGLADGEVFVIDTLDLGDPHHDKQLRSHIGIHDWAMQVMHALVGKVHKSVKDGKQVGVIAYCRRNRHRSVAFGWLISCALEYLEISCPAVADVITADMSTWMSRQRQKIMQAGCVTWPVMS